MSSTELEIEKNSRYWLSINTNFADEDDVALLEALLTRPYSCRADDGVRIHSLSPPLTVAVALVVVVVVAVLVVIPSFAVSCPLPLVFRPPLSEVDSTVGRPSIVTRVHLTTTCTSSGKASFACRGDNQKEHYTSDKNSDGWRTARYTALRELWAAGVTAQRNVLRCKPNCILPPLPTTPSSVFSLSFLGFVVWKVRYFSLLDVFTSI